MLLLVDIGNSGIKWFLVRTARGALRPAVTPLPRNHAEVEAALRRALRQGKPDAVVVASVVPKVGRMVCHCVRHHGLDCFELGFKQYARIMEITVQPRIAPGADRLANAFALRTLHALPACAVDVGTAVTFDVVDAAGRFVGGGIMPGERLQIESLAKGTALLGAVRKIPRSVKGMGTTTAEAMAFAVRHGIKGAVAGVLDAIEAALHTRLATVVVTGGGGKTVHATLRKVRPEALYDGSLTLRGMMLACDAIERGAKGKWCRQATEAKPPSTRVCASCCQRLE